MLAKCLLEKIAIDAADIFSARAVCRPDDFVSHIGMSIAREDESNLDAAIWHMERAFEVQPSSETRSGRTEATARQTRRHGAA